MMWFFVGLLVYSAVTRLAVLAVAAAVASVEAVAVRVVADLAVASPLISKPTQSIVFTH